MTDIHTAFAPIVVRTRYAGPTNTRGARIIASLWLHEERLAYTIVPYAHELDQTGSHWKGVCAVLRKVRPDIEPRVVEDASSVVTRSCIPGDESAYLWSISHPSPLCDDLLRAIREDVE